jgi:ABC-2 type transport system permease protein
MLKIIYARFLNLRRNYIPYLIFLALPLTFMFVFGGVMNDGDGRIQLPVVDNDKSEYSLALTEELSNLDIYNVRVTGMEELQRLVSENMVEVGLVIPEGFQKSIIDGKEPRLDIVIIREGPSLYSLEGVLMSSIQRINYNINIVNSTVKVIDKYLKPEDMKKESIRERVYDLVSEKWKERLPVSVTGKVEKSDNSVSFNMYTQTSIGFTLAFTMFTFTFAVGEILEEKKNKVWERINISPLSKFQVYMGNLIYACVIGLLQMMIMAAVGDLALGVNWRANIPGVLIVFVSFTFCTVSLGLLMSSMIRTHQQLQVIAPILLVSTSMVGGCYWPLEIVNSWILLAASKIVPQGWAMKGLKDLIVYNRSIEAAYLPAAVLVLMGVIFIGTALQVNERTV